MEKRIIGLARKAFEMFPHKIEEPKFKVLTRKNFRRLLLRSPIIKHHEGDIKYSPSLSCFKNNGNVEVCFCPEILKNFSDKDDFIIALALHEFYHIWNKILINDESDAIKSENLVHHELGKDFPQYAKLLNSPKIT